MNDKSRAEGRGAPLNPALKSETETVEQDRLSGPGFAGQDRQSGGEGKVQSLDQDDVAN